jgi:hypothetical protein
LLFGFPCPPAAMSPYFNRRCLSRYAVLPYCFDL